MSARAESGPAPGGARNARLLELLRALARELHPQEGSFEQFGEDDALERDFGLDSLARVELAARIERELGVRLPDAAFGEAETPRDLLRFLGAAPPEGPAAARPAVGRPAEAVDGAPLTVQTLVDAFDWHTGRHPGRVHIVLYGEHETPEEITYGALAHDSCAFAAGLTAGGVRPGERVALMLPTGRDFFVAFYGTLRVGAIPVPLYPPARPAQLEQHVKRIAATVANCGAVIFVTFEQAKPFAQLLCARGSALRQVAAVREVLAAVGTPPAHRAAAGDTAFLQYTSGSTGNPKGVVLSHANLLANLRAMGAAARARSTDTFVSWLPLYHDMGLIGACLGAMLYAFPVVLMAPLAFLARPERWLQRVHRHRATITAGPNFAYELCVTKVRDEEIEGLDLSSLRIAFNGAEAVSPDTVERFCERFARYGLRREAMTPVYGLAESSLGLAFPPLERGVWIDRIDRTAFQAHGLARPARSGDPLPLRVVSCGRALAGHAIRAVDAGGREVIERVQGRIQFRGPSATAGYFGSPEETAKLIQSGWLDTGDLGYLVGGELFITGRAKDIIIRGGHNIHPQELEQAASTVKGVRRGGVAVFAAGDARTGTERLVVLAETREVRAEERTRIVAAINHLAVDLIGLPADEVVLARPRTVLKTSSGKVRRAACRALYERGALGVGAHPAWLQLARLAFEAAAIRVRRGLRRAAEIAWGLRAATAFALLAPPAWALIALTRDETRARAIARHCARLLLRLCGALPRVEGEAHLAAEPHAIVVSNHASYLDGIVFAAAMPPRAIFVAKSELAGQRIVGTLLRRLGAMLVERVDATRGAQDRFAIEERARAGVIPLVFAEGTFRREPGLMSFHMGAFVAAAAEGLPLVPVVLRGTRAMMPDGVWFPRPSPIEVLVCEPLRPDGSDWHAAIRLRDRARQVIYERLGEPDAAGVRVDFKALRG